MDCEKHFLGFRWARHDWERRVVGTEGVTFPGTDMWSRKVDVPQVACHVQHVCRKCGAVRDDGICECDVQRGEVCAVRLAYLAKEKEQPPASATATARDG